MLCVCVCINDKRVRRYVEFKIQKGSLTIVFES